MKIIQDNPDKPWHWGSEHYCPGPGGGISNNPNVSCEFIETNIDKPWDWEMLSGHPNITWEIIQANPDKPCYILIL